MHRQQGRFGAVAAGHKETAEAASEVLAAGGNAFDAAVAGFFAACVAEPVLASLGGGGFMMVQTPDGHVEAIDFFTQTPKRAARQSDVDFTPIVADFGTAQQEFHIGLGAVATPGAVAGVFAVHDAYGRMPMREIVAPAIALAFNGVIINPFQAYLLSVIGPIYVSTQESIDLFCRSQEREPTLKVAGDTYAVPEFADFLTALADEGADLFYQGVVAAEIDAMNGCTIDADDLGAYAVERRTPLSVDLPGHRVFLNPPPAIGGALVALALDILADDASPWVPGESDYLDAVLTAMQKCSFARKHSAIDTDPHGGSEALREALRHAPAYRGTTHISAVDADGNVAAMTVSNGEGCGHIIPGTGIMLNNMLGEEDLNAAGFFAWKTNTRLSSMMTPGIMASDAGVRTAFGSGGSNRIRSALTQVIINLAVLGADVREAVSAPRLHLEGGKLSVEPGFSEDALSLARGRVEEVEVWDKQNMFFGGAHLASIDDAGHFSGFGDPRRDGVFKAV